MYDPYNNRDLMETAHLLARQVRGLLETLAGVAATTTTALPRPDSHCPHKTGVVEIGFHIVLAARVRTPVSAFLMNWIPNLRLGMLPRRNRR